MLGASRWLALAALVCGCRTGRPYTHPAEPRHAGPAPAPPSAPPRWLRVVTFNLEFAYEVDAAIALLSTHPELRAADVVLLQEMDAEGTRRVAGALGMGWVYYPALRHQRTGRDFGNAVLSRWPIVEDEKLVLPHRSWYAGTHRLAVAATIDLGRTRLRVYSTHLGTPLDINDRGRREQLRAILDDGARHPHVLVAGDMNTSRVGGVARDAGWAWATARIGRTTRLGRWDHVFVRGLEAGDARVVAARGISDHDAVVVRVALPAP